MDKPLRKYKKILRLKLSKKRYWHSIAVAYRAKKLAKIHSLDTEKAFIAGLLHDITKEESIKNQLIFLKEFGIIPSREDLEVPSVLHSLSGSVFVREMMDIKDAEIVSGIKYHTTGHKDMTQFDMVIYLADFTAVDRRYDGVKKVRKISNKSLQEGMAYALSLSDQKMREMDKKILSVSSEALEYFLKVKGENND